MSNLQPVVYNMCYYADEPRLRPGRLITSTVQSPMASFLGGGLTNNVRGGGCIVFKSY